MNISKGLRNSVTELLSICDEQINRWKLTREQLAMLTTNGHSNGHVPQVLAMAEAAIQQHETNGTVKKVKHTRKRKGLHWTQTPAGRKKMAMHMKRRNAEKLAAEAGK